jgi:hypothetical protein
LGLALSFDYFFHTCNFGVNQVYDHFFYTKTYHMFRLTLISLALGLIERFLIAKINYSPLRLYLTSNIGLVGNVADILTDEDPENDEQLEDLWEKNKGKLVNSSLDTAAQIILNEVEDEEFAAYVADLILGLKKPSGARSVLPNERFVQDTLPGIRMAVIKIATKAIDRYLIQRIGYDPMKNFLAGRVALIERIADKLTDADPDNAAQLKAIWEEEKKELIGASLDTVIEIIGEEIEDEATAEFLIQLILTLKIGQ